MVAKRERWHKPDIERLRPEFESPDEEVRGGAVRALCPCHAGWEIFEENVGVVLRSLKDPSRVVRAHALHVLEDASRMKSATDMRYQPEPGVERMGEKRAQGFRSMEERLEALRESRLRRRRRRHGARAGREWS